MNNQLYYVVSVKHTKRTDKYITLWNPDDKGYCFSIDKAGKYTFDQIEKSLNYYHTGYDIAVKCEILDAICCKSEEWYLDNICDVVKNKSSTWFDIMYAPTWNIPIDPFPQYRGARYKK
jgi:hypothetical protein